MNQDEGLPPRPSLIKPKDYNPGTDTLPPLTARTEGVDFENSGHSSLESDAMDRGALSAFFDKLKYTNSWTTKKIIALIFIGSFIFSVLFTSSILAGIIEIHPASVKKFFKTLMGKS